MRIRILLLFISAFLFLENARAQNVFIIESLSGGHIMDQYWYDVVTAAGGTATIQPQTILDNYASFGGADILIVASGIINIPANRANNILLYVAFGHNVYLQSEYDINFSTNQVFESIVNSLGGSFNWVGQVPGILQPTISTSIATTPNTIVPLDYHWYGAKANFCLNIESFVKYQSDDLGFIFCGTGGVGRIVTTSDQDWILHQDTNDVHLMENIYYNLRDTAYSCNAISYPNLNLGVDTSICAGDTLLLNAGVGFTSYQWQNGSTDSTLMITTPGNYWVTVATPCTTYIDTVHVVTGSCALQPSSILSASDSIFCGQQCVDFFDLSTYNPTSWQWFFPGADSASSTLQNPTNICYNTYGSFNVTLITCNAIGCDTLVLSNFIRADSLPTVNLGNDTLICDNDSIVLDAGAGFSSYLWSDNSTLQTITISSAGNYVVQIANGSCFSTDTMIVTTQSCAAAVALFSSSDTSFCEKLCIDFLDLSTNNPTSWQWFFPGADSLTSSLQNPTNICYNTYGSFDVTLIACNGFGCDTVSLPGFINEYQTPVPVVTQSNDTLFSTPAVSYQWWSVGNGIIAGATNYYYVPTQGGDYYVIISDSVGCAGTSNVIIITGINQLATGNGLIAIVPNPNNGNFSITFNHPVKEFSLRIYNAMGQLISFENKNMQTVSANGNILSIDLGKVPDGFYSCELIAGSQVYRQLFIIAK